mmetsp:Transcript_27562/g.50503  ORF Transcript_27562/g.50503 Transcript_27562/m.50503 type:complete len:310 (+) Transcript_27562:30-959(+)
MASHIATRFSPSVVRIPWRACSAGGTSGLISTVGVQFERFPNRRQASGVGNFLKWLSGDTKADVAPQSLARTDFGNCGVGMGNPIPQPELVLEEGVERYSREWTVQLYGAALYWHVASTPAGTFGPKDADQLRDRDVLEVGCTLGGGARYLAEVAGPRMYVATDVNPEHVAECSSREKKHPGLHFQCVDAMQISEVYHESSFDFVLAVQVVNELGDGMSAFFDGAAQVLRPKGRLIFCDALTESETAKVKDLLGKSGFNLVASNDLSTKVRPIGLCKLHFSREYMHFIAEKPMDWTSPKSAGAEASSQS